MRAARSVIFEFSAFPIIFQLTEKKGKLNSLTEWEIATHLSETSQKYPAMPHKTLLFIRAVKYKIPYRCSRRLLAVDLAGSRTVSDIHPHQRGYQPKGKPHVCATADSKASEVGGYETLQKLSK